MKKQFRAGDLTVEVTELNDGPLITISDGREGIDFPLDQLNDVLRALRNVKDYVRQLELQHEGER